MADTTDLDSCERIVEVRKKQLEEIREVYNDNKLLTRAQMETKYGEFAEKYPKTWVNILDNKFQLSHLERQVEVYEHMFKKSKGRTYEQKKYETEKQFGEKLAEQYLYPTFGKPDNEAMKAAEESVKKNMKGESKGNIKKVDLVPI